MCLSSAIGTEFLVHREKIEVTGHNSTCQLSPVPMRRRVAPTRARDSDARKRRGVLTDGGPELFDDVFLESLHSGPHRMRSAEVLGCARRRGTDTAARLGACVVPRAL